MRRTLENVKKQISQLEWCEVNDGFPSYLIANKELFEDRMLIDHKETVFR